MPPALLLCRFVKGAIEQLQAAGVEAGSIDVIISNCVINLSPDKPAVLREAYRALTQGGEMYFSDVYCDRRLPAAIRKHEVLLGECLGGALAINDFARLCKEVSVSAVLCCAVLLRCAVMCALPWCLHYAVLCCACPWYSVTLSMYRH